MVTNSSGNNIPADITVSESKLRSTLDRYKTLTSKINEFLWSVIYADNKEDIFYTDSIEKITGYTSEQVKAMPGRGLSLIHSDDAFNVRRLISEFENDPLQLSLSLIYRIIKKSGDIIWIKESLTAERDRYGKITRMDGIVSDISELKSTENALKASEDKLRQLNAAKDRFIAIVSHDLRAPFTSILGFAEILINEPNLPEQEKLEYLNYIYESSQSQLQLVNYLLDWSRLQTGRIKIEPQRLKAKTVVVNSISYLTGNAIRKNIEIKSIVPDDVYILADERLIMQAVNNLLSNSIKFTCPGKEIEINVGIFKKGFIEFVVKDQGMGISDANKTRIFQIDQKFTSEGTRGEKGSGLGLTLVKEIVEKHGGDIWFYSEFEKGSEFHFTIPEAPNNVLLVQHDDNLRLTWNKILRKHLPNWNIIETSNGFEAMGMMVNTIPSLVITDHEMPLMNGVQLIESIRKGDENNRIPIIVIGGKLNEGITQKYMQLGVEVILQKPLDTKIFIGCINKFLS